MISPGSAAPWRQRPGPRRRRDTYLKTKDKHKHLQKLKSKINTNIGVDTVMSTRSKFGSENGVPGDELSS